MPELRLYNIQRQEYDSFAEQYLLPEDFELASKTPIKKPNAYELDAILNKELFEGDILGIDPVSGGLLNEERIFNSDLIKNGNDEEKALFGTPYYSALNTQTYADKLWADAKVPYVLEQGMSPTQRASIASAFDEYKGKTCIRFVPRQETDPDFIYIKRNNAFGCSSYVGRAGGNQTVSLEVDKCFSKGIIAHELMHALGFFHEHSRTDRDDFVEIQEENIRPGMLRNFEKYPRKIIDPLTMPYDYDSVMHYHKLAFSRNGRPTIVPKKGDAEIGQRYKLSEIDSQKVNKLYRCSDAKKVETTTAETTIKTTEATTIETNTEESDEQSTDETETTTESSPSPTTTSPTSEETAVTVDEFEEETTTEGTNEETEEEYISTKTKSNEKQKIRTGARERQGPHSKEIELLPGGIARKFITLSIWSTRGRTDGDRKSFGRKNKGMTKIEEKISNECVDLNAHCEMWEKLGHCMHSTKYMNHYCRKSCGFCDREERSEIDSPKPKCTDKNHFCSYWARNGECDDGSKFMKLFCERSCGFC